NDLYIYRLSPSPARGTGSVAWVEQSGRRAVRCVSLHEQHRPAERVAPGAEPVEVGARNQPGRIERDAVGAGALHAVDEHGDLAAQHVVDGETDVLRTVEGKGDRGGWIEGVGVV